MESSPEENHGTSSYEGKKQEHISELTMFAVFTVCPIAVRRYAFFSISISP